VSHAASMKNIALIGPELNEDHEAYFNQVYGDQSRFMQILINFLSNSIKFSERNSKIKVNLNFIESQVIGGVK
jgi:signal transduction histidine kinase